MSAYIRIVILFFSINLGCLTVYLQNSGDASESVNLLTVLGIPTPGEGITYVKGIDGYPVFSLLPYAKLTPKPASVHFRGNTIYEDFAITLTFKLKSRAGVLFAVVNYNGVMQLSVKIEQHSTSGFHNLGFYYTPHSQDRRRSVRIANFVVSGLERKWVKIGLKVKGDTVSLYKNCEYVSSERVNRSRLVFEPGSSLLIGNGGRVIGNRFVGDIMEMKIHADPEKANEDDCSLDFTARSGSGKDSVDGSGIEMDDMDDLQKDFTARSGSGKDSVDGSGIEMDDMDDLQKDFTARSGSGKDSVDGSGIEMDDMDDLQKGSIPVKGQKGEQGEKEERGPTGPMCRPGPTPVIPEPPKIQVCELVAIVIGTLVAITVFIVVICLVYRRRKVGKARSTRKLANQDNNEQFYGQLQRLSQSNDEHIYSAANQPK